MRIDKQVTITRSSTPVETTVGSEVVLMTLDTGECLGLGETGSDVWRLLASPTHLDPIIASLSETYAAPPGVIEQDVIELLEQFLDRGLIELQ
jgi:hypothetical protein